MGRDGTRWDEKKVRQLWLVHLFVQIGAPGKGSQYVATYRPRTLKHARAFATRWTDGVIKMSQDGKKVGSVNNRTVGVEAHRLRATAEINHVTDPDQVEAWTADLLNGQGVNEDEWVRSSWATIEELTDKARKEATE